uniref:PAP-associated domain-containing protein n=1 Tax=Cafeteria roenbergensis TaxID=33653 RepID=A0A7S0JXP7_CAFRO
MALQYVAKTKADGTFDWARFRCTLVNVQADGLLSLAQLLLQMMDAYKPDPGSYSAYAASAMAAAILVTNIGEVPMYGRFLKGCISLYFPPLLGRLIPPRSPSEVASSRAGAAAAKPPPQPKPGPRSKKAKAKAKAKAKKARARQPAAAAACSSATDFKINAMPRFPAYCQWSNWRFRASQLDRKDVCVSFSDVRHSALPPTQEELSAAVRREAASVLAVEGAGTTGLDMAFAELRELASKVFLPSKGVRVAAFGSAVTGLATRGSDVDVVLVGHSGEDSKTADEIRSAKESDKRGDGSSPLIYSLLMELNRSDRVFRLDGHRPHAKVPVLKLTHRPSNTNIDVVCNNVLGVHNSRLLRAYMTFDVLQRPLALASIVKLWARRRNINDSTQDTLSSYAYTLMVVFFLQQRGVLPNLQAPGLLRAYERWRGAPMPAVTVHGFKLRYCADEEFLGKLAEFRLESRRFSTESIGSLLLGFFTYYASVFDWEQHAVSVRLGRPRPRKGWEAGVRGRMGIEDPFENERDLCATLGKNGRLRGQERIFSELGRARDILMRGMSGGAGELGAVLEELLGK